MSKARSRAADYAVYLVVRMVVCLIQALPPTIARRLAGGFAWIAYRVNRRHRLVAMENLSHAFPSGIQGADLDQVVCDVYRHFCTLMIEIVRLPREMHVENWRNHLELKGGRQLVSVLLSGRPVLLVTGHFGNWELAGYALGLFGFKAHAIARPLDNPYVDDFLRGFRERTGQRVLAKKGDFDQMQSILDAGGVIATLADQDAGARGQFVDYFGRPASTHKAVALLSLEHRVPLVVLGARKVREPMQYELIIQDVIWPEEYSEQPDAIRAITQRFTAALEQVVRTAPEQYFWLHRRWKHQPAKARRRVA
jgi:KDO2-lipid IV(A) lauroyltransferase